MAQFVNMRKVELNDGAAPIVSLSQIYQNNNKANRIGAIVTQDGAPLSLGGSCSGTAIRADGNTVPLTGTINGNQAYVVLDSTCYAVEGELIVTVTWVDSTTGEQTTLLYAVGTVKITSSGAVIQPTTPIPDLEQLLAQIETLQSATADAETAAAAIRAIDCEIPASFESGNITNSGTTTTTNSRIKSASPILIQPGMWWNVGGEYEAGVAIFSGNAFTSANFVGYVGGSASTWYTGNIVLPAEYTGKYMGIRIQKIGHTSEDISGDVATIGDYVKLNDPANVLSLSNYADYFNEAQYLPERRAASFVWEVGRRVNENGTENTSVYAALTTSIPVTEHTLIQNRTPAQDADSHAFNVYIAEYKNGVFYKRTQIASGEIFTTADDVDSIKLMAIYPSTEGVSMSASRLNATFAVGMVRDMIPGDGERPVYVAFGASTTVGAIHHYTGESVTYTPYAYPDYIGAVLGMDTYNLGQGTTGFMARDSGNKANFMDQIYNNGAILANANLITLTFGYGNDESAGLPFGLWNDYFPYDTEAQFYVAGATADNAAGVTTMLSHGATLMGCLNWCIKWIGDHYPKATLVLIWGAPSENAQKTVAVSTNSASGAGTSGVAPKIITVTPSANSLVEYDEIVTTLAEKLNIPFINLVTDMLPFSYYSSVAKDGDVYAIFSTKGTAESPVWNSHPNEDGYKIYARFLAGRILQFFTH